MKKRLEMLEQLQEIDIQIDVLKNSQNGLNTELDSITQGLDVAREELAALEERVRLLELEKTEYENSLVDEQENIHRSETNMKEIKTNKEFQAVGREITAARKKTTELEEQTLQKLGQIEELKSEIITRTTKLAELEQNAGQRRKEKETEVNAIQQNIDSDAQRREKITSELPANLIQRYGKLRLQRRGHAVAFARDGYCLGCNMQLPPQLYNSLYRTDDIVSCPHCQRILILKLKVAC